MVTIIIISAFLVCLLAMLVVFYALDQGELTVIKKEGSILTLKYEKENESFQVEGGSTVWHFYPSGKRCDTMLESEIVDAVKKYKYTLKQKNV